jgi:hypothetical protein
MLRQRQHAIASQPAATQVGEQMQSPVRQMPGQADRPVVLLLGPLGLPLLVIDVLATAGGVGAHRLDVAVRMRANPHLLPRRRNDQRLDSRQCLSVDRVALTCRGRDIGKAAAPAHTANTGPVNDALAQPHLIPLLMAER